MADEQELDRIAYEINALQSQGRQLQEQMAKLQYAFGETEATIQALKSLPQIKQETWFPIGADTMVKVKISDSSNVLIDVGGRVMAEKTVAEATELLEKRKSEISKNLSEFEKAFVEVSRRMQALNQVAQQKIAASQSRK